jgi:abequosyltransferase
MSSISLSICIPTYNFGKFIGSTLDSIIPNLKDGVEVVILDGGSTDDTGQVVAQRQRNYPQIKYFPQEKRGGIDRDIAKVVTLAQGDYCWLFSADDIMKPDAVEKVLHALESQCDIYLCEHVLCDFEMNPITAYPIFSTITNPETFHLGNMQERKKYFRAARTSEAFFSFLSGPIFRRELWEKTNGIPESFYETCWALSGRLLSLVQNGLTIQYLGTSLLYKRGENDSFLDLGVVNRLRISVDGFTHIAETIFGKSSFETCHIRRVIRNERPFSQLIMIKLYTSEAEMPLLNRLVWRHYSHAGFSNYCKYLLFRWIPVSFLMFLRFIKRIIVKRSFKAMDKSIMNK